MKKEKMVCSLLLVGALAGNILTLRAQADEMSITDKAKLTQAEAGKIALTRVPNGILKEGELEMEKGILIWSFNIALPDSKNIKEIGVNAVTGKVIGVDTETLEDQAKEAAADAKEEKAKKQEAALLAMAKISKEDAEKIALGKVPSGTIKESELEEEKGKLIWSFDISTPDSKNITEVAVDAKNGEVVSVDIETPKDQAKEAAEDARKEGKE